MFAIKIYFTEIYLKYINFLAADNKWWKKLEAILETFYFNMYSNDLNFNKIFREFSTNFFISLR